MAFKVRQRDIRDMIANGEAVDVTGWPDEKLYEIRRITEKLCFSIGVYGGNGVVRIGPDGKKYAAPSRSSAQQILA